MLRTDRVVLMGALAYLVYFYYTRSQPAQPVVAGVKALKMPATPSFSGNWKNDHPVPTNLFGSHPYGWSGSSAGSYLPGNQS